MKLDFPKSLKQIYGVLYIWAQIRSMFYMYGLHCTGSNLYMSIFKASCLPSRPGDEISKSQWKQTTNLTIKGRIIIYYTKLLKRLEKAKTKMLVCNFLSVIKLSSVV